MEVSDDDFQVYDPKRACETTRFGSASLPRGVQHQAACQFEVSSEILS